MITHATSLVVAAERRALVAQAERFGHLHGDLPRRPRRWRRSRAGRLSRRRPGAERAASS